MAANHIFGLGDVVATTTTVVAILAISAASRKLDEWQGKLPEFNALVGGLADLDPNSEDAQEIGSIILKLDEFCD